MALVLDGTNGLSGVDGSASTPAVQGSDSNTGVFYPAADTVAIGTNGSERMRVNSSGNVGIGTTSPTGKTHIAGASVDAGLSNVLSLTQGGSGTGTAAELRIGASATAYYSNIVSAYSSPGSYLYFGTSADNTNPPTERARITSGGDMFIGKTASTISTAGVEASTTKGVFSTVSGDSCLQVNRLTNDGDLVLFRQDNTAEGTISVSGTTVSYNGGNLARYAQLTVPKDETNLLKGTVMSNLDEMNVYTKDGEPVPNEQLNKVKVSDVEGDVNVAGVFVNWSYDEQHQVDEINMAMTGDMIIRIAQGVVVQKGDLLMSAGDGTAKPQEDDIIRSKTVAKVTSNHVTCTYEDGSYCVPCVLMAC